MTQSGHPPHFHLNLRPPTDRRNNHERLRRREPRDRRDPRHLSDDHRRAARDGDRDGGCRLPLVARRPRGRAGGAHPPGRGAPPRAARRARRDHRARDGQAARRGPRRGRTSPPTSRSTTPTTPRRSRATSRSTSWARAPPSSAARRIGVLLGIMPWNFPYYQVARFAAPNLVIGNTILLKHAPQCPESAAAIEQIYRDAGLPEGAYMNLYATNEQAATVIADPRVQGVSVTGSERAGAAVARGRRSQPQEGRARARRVRPVHPAVDRRPRRRGAAPPSRRAWTTTGSRATPPKRFIVVDGLYDAFLEKFTAAMTGAKVGDPFAEDTVLGPLSSLAAAERLAEQVDKARRAGRDASSPAARATARSTRRRSSPT